jgi:hypothetical protein
MRRHEVGPSTFHNKIALGHGVYIDNDVWDFLDEYLRED